MGEPACPVEPSPRVEMGFMNESTRRGCTVHILSCHLFFNCPSEAHQCLTRSDRSHSAAPIRRPSCIKERALHESEEYDELHNHLNVDVNVRPCVRACLHVCVRERRGEREGDSEREGAHVSNSHILLQLHFLYCTTA